MVNILSGVLIFTAIVLGCFYYKNYKQKEIILILFFILLSELYILRSEKNIFTLLLEVFSIIMFLMILKFRKSINAFKVFVFIASIYIFLSFISEIGLKYGIWFYGVLMIAVLLKLAVFPVMWWLPKLVADVDSITAAVFICLSEVVDFALLVDIMNKISNTNSGFYEKTKAALILIGILTIFIGAIMAFAEKDLKKMLAYSSIDDVGYLLIGIGIFSNMSIIASIILFTNHIIAKLGMFLITDKLERLAGTLDMEKLGGEAQRFPFGAVSFLTFALTLIGVPFFPGFTGKYLIYLSGLKESVWLSLGMILGSIITLVYYIRAYHNVFLGTCKVEVKKFKKDLSDFVLIIMAIFIVGAGIFVSLPILLLNLDGLTHLLGRL
ncbi:Ech-type complex subunit Ech2A2 [Thermoanaerobacter kivui]|uniref:Ech-type complex subunit Ech2A2 n=1 Tax=Thermoanaerobacter kivui TaxID=2325 RepID=A0A097ATF1_THEKI|nr:proton-conducting transporter membrane subunit [Thermoanaerobacter kivui]AIS53115.1 Ech-type complex subunit Ech2A2 [Thermoanaerobacter kivui]